MGVFDDRERARRDTRAGGRRPATDRGYDLYWIAVDPRAQGGGYGSALMRAVEDAAARLAALGCSWPRRHRAMRTRRRAISMRAADTRNARACAGSMLWTMTG